jgi:thiol-disulfide isomerase/thioredoxin
VPTKAKPLYRLALAALSSLLGVALVLEAGLPNRLDLFIPNSDQKIVAPEVGAQSPTIRGRDLFGQTIDSDQWLGRPFIINFWATWCAPCQAEIPLLNLAAGQNADLLVLGINAGEDPALVSAFAQQFELNFPILVDDGRWARLYEVPGLPTTFFVDRAGQVVHIVYGPLTDADWLHNFLAGFVQIGKAEN